MLYWMDWTPNISCIQCNLQIWCQLISSQILPNESKNVHFLLKSLEINRCNSKSCLIYNLMYKIILCVSQWKGENYMVISLTSLPGHLTNRKILYINYTPLNSLWQIQWLDYWKLHEKFILFKKSRVIEKAMTSFFKILKTINKKYHFIYIFTFLIYVFRCSEVLFLTSIINTIITPTATKMTYFKYYPP